MGAQEDRGQGNVEGPSGTRQIRRVAALGIINLA